MGQLSILSKYSGYITSNINVTIVAALAANAAHPQAFSLLLIDFVNILLVSCTPISLTNNATLPTLLATNTASIITAIAAAT